MNITITASDGTVFVSAENETSAETLARAEAYETLLAEKKAEELAKETARLEELEQIKTIEQNLLSLYEDYESKYEVLDRNNQLRIGLKTQVTGISCH